MPPSGKSLTLRPVVERGVAVTKYDVIVLGRSLGTVTRGQASAMFKSRWGSKKLYGSFIDAIRDLGAVADRIAGRADQI